MQAIDYLFCDYDELSIPERMQATAAAREAARSHTGPASDSPWTALDADDPRRVAFESEIKKWK